MPTALLTQTARRDHMGSTVLLHAGIELRCSFTAALTHSRFMLCRVAVK